MIGLREKIETRIKQLREENAVIEEIFITEEAYRTMLHPFQDEAKTYWGIPLHRVPSFKIAASIIWHPYDGSIKEMIETDEV